MQCLLLLRWPNALVAPREVLAGAKEKKTTVQLKRASPVIFRKVRVILLCDSDFSIRGLSSADVSVWLA